METKDVKRSADFNDVKNLVFFPPQSFCIIFVPVSVRGDDLDPGCTAETAACSRNESSGVSVTFCIITCSSYFCCKLVQLAVLYSLEISKVFTKQPVCV